MEEVSEYGLDSSVSGQGTIAGSFKHANDPSGTIKVENFMIS
jgi:hypothetical protein